MEQILEFYNSLLKWSAVKKNGNVKLQEKFCQKIKMGRISKIDSWINSHWT